MPHVLIISHSHDVHADGILPKLLAKACTPFRINLDHFPRDYRISQRWLGGCSQQQITHLPSGQQVDLAWVGAIWVRKAADYAFLSELGAQERAYAKDETDQALFGLLYSLDCFWLSHPTALRAAMWKPEQLQRARRLGFTVPPTLISNCPHEVRAFAAAIPGPLIFKLMSSPYLGAEQVAPQERLARHLPTTLVDAAMLENLDGVRELPCQFQQYIAKQYELRVTLIGEQVFAAKIHSQDDARTRIDVRDMSAPVRYEATELAPELRQRCLDLMHSYGLHYSAMDLIVTPDNEVVFLENNPNGQFLYIERLIPQFALLDALAEKLCREAQCRPA